MQSSTHGGSAYGVKYQARCISALSADLQETSFLVGTLSLREENEVHRIKYSASTGDLTCEGLYAHQHEIWDLASCPFDPLIFSTVHASAGDFGATIWKMPEHSKSSSQLEKLADLNGHTMRIKCTLWWQSGKKHTQLLSVDEEALYVWDIDSSGRSVQVDKKMSPGMLHHMANGAWDPHDVESVATVSDSCVQFWDLRSTKQTQALETAHAHDMDYNPQKQHHFVTVGDESQIRIWDKRMLGIFLQQLPGHPHWTWRVRYNPKCDEYLLSSGTDSLVNLWSVTAFHGGKSGIGSPEDSPRAQTDPLLRSYNGHEDSVYGLSADCFVLGDCVCACSCICALFYVGFLFVSGIAWSLREPWIFASLSYDGRVLVDSVPQSIAKQIKHITQNSG